MEVVAEEPSLHVTRPIQLVQMIMEEIILEEDAVYQIMSALELAVSLHLSFGSRKLILCRRFE